MAPSPIFRNNGFSLYCGVKSSQHIQNPPERDVNERTWYWVVLGYHKKLDCNGGTRPYWTLDHLTLARTWSWPLWAKSTILAELCNIFQTEERVINIGNKLTNMKMKHKRVDEALAELKAENAGPQLYPSHRLTDFYICNTGNRDREAIFLSSVMVTFKRSSFVIFFFSLCQLLV